MTKCSAALAAGLLLAGTAAAGRAQEAERFNPIVFLEKSYLSPLSPFGKGLILEGQAANHYFIVNQFDDRVWQQGRSGEWQFAWPVSMVFVVRIFQDFSSPVRTPSFILRPLNLQGLNLSIGEVQGTGRSATYPFRLYGFSLMGVHHSNGQSGCTFQGFEAREITLPGGGRDLECAVADPALAQRRVTNLIDGSFSTNFLAGRLDYRWGKLDTHAVVASQWTVGLEGELHVLDFIPGEMSDDVERGYGRYVAGLRLEHERKTGSGVWAGTSRVEASSRLWFGGMKDGATGAAAMELSHVFKKAEHWGIFARLHTGRDYYNIWYQDHGWWLQFGMLWDPARLDQMSIVF